MPNFKVINQLHINAQGLVCHKKNGRSWQSAHHMQGGLDGACGVYAMTDALSILGLLDSDIIWNDDSIDGRSRDGKYVNAISEYNHNGIYKDGLESEDVIDILTRSFGKRIEIETCCRSGNDDTIVSFVCDNIDNDAPVIISLPGHWILAVGYSYDEEDSITGLCVLDPGSSNPVFTHWNGYVDLTHGTGRKADRDYYRLIPNMQTSTKVSIDVAISVALK